MKKILVVDDEREIRDFLKKALEKERFLVRIASSGEEAFVLAKADKPHLILLDIGLPGADGYGICERLKKDPGTKDIPVLFLTGKDLEPQSVIRHCDELGAVGYASKVSSPKELVEKLKGILYGP